MKKQIPISNHRSGLLLAMLLAFNSPPATARDLTVDNHAPDLAAKGAGTKGRVHINSDTGLRLELDNYSVNEDTGVVTIRVLRRDDGSFPVAVNYATSSGTAQPGQDYVHTTGTLNFAPGDKLKYVSITLLNDAIHEPNETFQFALNGPTGGGVLGTPSLATVTITDSDEIVGFKASSLTVREDAGFARMAVVRGESALATTAILATANGTATAGQDYTALNQVLAFAPGERLKYVDIPLLNDGVKESSETFRVELDNPVGGPLLGLVLVRVLDNDPGVGFESGTVSVWEKQGGLNLKVIRGSEDWLGPFTVNYQTADGSAQAGTDYQAASGTLNFAENEMVKSIPLTLLVDPASEAMKNFTVTLSGLTGGIAMGAATTVVTIVDGSQGNVTMVPPTMRAGIGKYGGLVEVSWPGSAEVLRADTVTGPWEQLGTMDGPLAALPQLRGAFYQLRSPRPARVYVPSSYDGHTLLPLVLVLHGYGGDAASYLDALQIEPLAELRGFLVCHPEGTRDRDNSRFWNATEACCDFFGKSVDDSSYLRGLIEELARQYPVDPKRIYLMGHSNGGFMAYRMACDHADLIAGIASVAGVTFLDANTHRPSQPVNVLQIHGTADEVVPYAGGAVLSGFPVVALFPGALATVQTWAGFNGCQNPLTDAQPSLDLDLDLPGLDTTVLHWSVAPPGGAVDLWTINNGSHGPNITTQFSPLVIDWLLAHPKP